jgi:hypothetical protein
MRRSTLALCLASLGSIALAVALCGSDGTTGTPTRG